MNQAQLSAIAGMPCAARLGPSTLSDVVCLVKTNMEAMYDACPGWQWSSAAKRRELRHPDMRFLIVGESRVEGVLCFRIMDEDGPELYIWEVQVLAEKRGHGIGKRLIQAAERIAHHHNLPQCTLTVFKHNPKALAFFTSMGYTPDETDPTECGDETGGYFILSKTIPSCSNSA